MQACHDAGRSALPSRAGPLSAAPSGKSAPPIGPRGCLRAIIEPGDRGTIEGDNSRSRRIFSPQHG